MPPDLAEVFDVIAKAQQAIVFLAFEPGSPSIVDAIAEALEGQALAVRPRRGDRVPAAGDFIHGDHRAATPAAKHQRATRRCPRTTA